MFWFLFGVYTFFLAIIWGFFIVIRIHALKFENFQTLIRKIIRIMCFTLGVLSLIGYIVIYQISSYGIDASIKLDSSSGLNDTNIDVNFY